VQLLATNDVLADDLIGECTIETQRLKWKHWKPRWYAVDTGGEVMLELKWQSNDGMEVAVEEAAGERKASIEVRTVLTLCMASIEVR
jgi:hypothetical protein